MKKIKQILIFSFVALTLFNCSCTSKVNTQKESSMAKVSDFDKLLSVLNKENNYEGPFKKNPFMMDYEFSENNKTIQISSYNSKFKLITKENQKGRIGQYDSDIKEVTKLINLLKKNNSSDNKEALKTKVLYRVKTRAEKSNKPNVDNFTLLEDNNQVTISNEDKETLQKLIFNVSENNKLYNLKSTVGFSGPYTPTIAVFGENNKVALVGFRYNLIKIYENKEVIAGGKINLQSEEFKTIKKIVLKYYPNLKY